jgi:trigger factor
MNLKNVEKQEKSTAVLTIEVTGAEFDAAIQKVYNRQKSRIQIPGFRKGKAPRKIIEQMYGSAVFYEDAINDIYPEALTAAVKESGLNMVGYPKVEMDGIPGPDGFTFLATIGVKPEVKIGQYKGLSAAKPAVVVTDEDIQAELAPKIRQASRQETVERAAENGDTVTIDFEGFKDGVDFEGGKAEGYALELGSGSFIPGFEEQVVGMTAGETREINVTFPEEYGVEDLNGAAVVFKVTVHEVKTTIAPELDDEFAKDVSEFDTLDELKADLAKKLEERRTNDVERTYKDAILTALIKGMETEIPETMVDFEADQMIENYASQFQGQSFTFEQYLQMMGMTMADLREQAKVGALREIQSNLAYQAVAEAEGFEATEEDVNAEYASLAEKYGRPEEEVRARIPEEDVKNEVLLKKAEELVYSTATVEEAAAEETSASEE